jgi:hypothetical protein
MSVGSWAKVTLGGSEYAKSETKTRENIEF